MALMGKAFSIPYRNDSKRENAQPPVYIGERLPLLRVYVHEEIDAELV